MKYLLRTLAVASLLITANSHFSIAHAQGTAFTYQGLLDGGGAPAPNGLYDFRFKLFFDPIGNNQAGSTVLDNAVPTTNGLFLATIDFGAGIFTGSSYWLEVDVRTNNAATYTDLSPLQEVTPAPYAVFANTSSNLSGTLSPASLAGTYSNTITLNNLANTFAGNFSGNGANVSGVDATTLNGLKTTNFWQTSGNTGTTAGVNYLGTTDNQPLELHVIGERALRLEPTLTNGTANVIAGSPNNFVASGTVGATIGGGGATNYNGVSYTNSVAADYGTIGGGNGNSISGAYATIPGGYSNLVSGQYGFAAGQQAQAANQGAFVWADSQAAPFASTANDSFNVRARGGVKLVTGGAGMTLDGQKILTNNSSGVTLSNLSLTGALNLVGPNDNLAIGVSSLSSDTTGFSDVAVGEQALQQNTTGQQNSAFGTGALQSNTGGEQNTAVGFEALNMNQTGNFNTAVGAVALVNNTSGANNTALGINALGTTGSGSGNVGVGAGAAFNNTLGSDNVAIGQNALGNPTGNNNVALGSLAASAFTGNESSNIDIGSPGIVGDQNTIRIGTPGIQTTAIIAGVITGDGDGLTSTNFWGIGGNSGTTAGANYLGTSDNQPLELHVDGVRAFRLEPTATVPNVIGGFSGNTADNGAQGVTIGGGGTTSFANQVSATLGTVAGGSGNVIGTNANDTTIGGGRQNLIDSNAWGGVISGGHGNWIQLCTTSGSFLGNASYSAISGGYGNVVGSNAIGGTIGGGGGNRIGLSATFATIGGGENNTNNGNYSIIPGGFENLVTGNDSLAAGNLAQATNNGSFVWSDDSGTVTKSFTNNQFMARASGGVVLLTSAAASPASYATGTAGVALTPNATSWSTVSDRNAKKNFRPVNTEVVLDKLAAIPIQQWNYKWESDTDTPNIGPMAQDFKQAFFPGRDDKSISTLEFDGVELAAIQGLNQKLNEKDAEIQDLKKSVAELKQLVQTLSAKK